MTEFHAAFSHTGFTIEDQVVQGDKVVTEFSMTTTHRGTFLGAFPGGEEGIYSGIRIHRIVGDKITDEWSEGNLLGVLLAAFEREIQTRERRARPQGKPTTGRTRHLWTPFLTPIRRVRTRLPDRKTL